MCNWFGEQIIFGRGNNSRGRRLSSWHFGYSRRGIFTSNFSTCKIELLSIQSVDRKTMKQRLVCFDNIQTEPRTFVMYAENMEDLYSFMESSFHWFDRKRFEIHVSERRIGSFGREYVKGDILPKTEDLYIKVGIRQKH